MDPPNLGPLASLDAALKSHINVENAARTALRNILIRLAEIDSDITCSHYGAPSDDKDRPPSDDKDRPPTGDDYNLLFDAIVDEINAIVTE